MRQPPGQYVQIEALLPRCDFEAVPLFAMRAELSTCPARGETAAQCVMRETERR